MASKRYKSFAALKTQKFVYDVAVDGGVKNTSISIGTLPKSAFIVGGWAYVNTVPVGDTTTLAIGITGTTAGLYPATTATTLAGNSKLQLLPGVLNIGSGQAITTVDTPAEIVAVSRTGFDATTVVLDSNKEVLITLSNDNNLTQGKITIFIQYYMI
jgi:hypothetical protein